MVIKILVLGCDRITPSTNKNYQLIYFILVSLKTSIFYQKRNQREKKLIRKKQLMAIMWVDGP